MIGQALRGILSGIIQDTELVFLIELAVCEAVSNSIRHAHACNADCNVDVSVFLYTSDVVVKVIDTGIPLNADLLNQKRFRGPTSNDPVTVREGGRGLYLIYKIMDEVRYRSYAGKNILTMKKKHN